MYKSEAEYLDELKSKNDKHIYNIVTNGTGSEEYLKAARVIYDQRNLDAPKKQETIQNFDVYRNEARELLGRGGSIKEAAQLLQNKGIPYNHAMEMAKTLKPVKKEKDSNSIGIWTIVFFVFIVIRWTIRCSSN